MKSFDYRRLPADLATPAIANRVADLHRRSGRLELLETIHPKILKPLTRRRHIESTIASAHIEGIYLPATQMEALCLGKAKPTDAVEYRIVGYHDVLCAIDEGYEHMGFAPSFILEMHRQFIGPEYEETVGGYREKDHIFTEIDGRMQAVPVSPITAFETPLALGACCDALRTARDVQCCDPLLLMAIFTVDFLCIRPFEVGNGRMSRLMDLLMLQRAGYRIGLYVSLDALIEETADEYYASLNECAVGWDRGHNTYEPFVTYFLKTLQDAYGRLGEILSLSSQTLPNKTERVRIIFDSRIGKITKHDILAAYPDISVSTVELALGQLVKEGYIAKVGGGRSTGYIRCDDENED